MNLIKSKKPSHKTNTSYSLADKSRMLVLDLSLSKLSLDELDKVTQESLDAHTRFNEKRDLLILEFEDQHKKVDYMKRLPQWIWNRGCVLWECTDAQLEKWIYETLLDW